jgi:hypothetical protein
VESQVSFKAPATLEWCEGGSLGTGRRFQESRATPVGVMGPLFSAAPVPWGNRPDFPCVPKKALQPPLPGRTSWHAPNRNRDWTQPRKPKKFEILPAKKAANLGLGQTRLKIKRRLNKSSVHFPTCIGHLGTYIPRFLTQRGTVTHTHSGVESQARQGAFHIKAPFISPGVLVGLMRRAGPRSQPCLGS